MFFGSDGNPLFSHLHSNYIWHIEWKITDCFLFSGEAFRTCLVALLWKQIGLHCNHVFSCKAETKGSTSFLFQIVCSLCVLKLNAVAKGNLSNDVVENIRNTYLILSCTPFLTSEQPEFVGVWTRQGVESVPQGCWPMFTPMLPTGVLWTILETRDTVEHETPSGTYYHTPV